jgi:hypothetical protein
MKLTLTATEKQHIENMESTSLSPEAKLHIIIVRREITGLVKLHKTLKHHFGKPYAENILTLLRERTLPWDVLLELNIEVERRIANQLSSDAILQYLQISARPDLLIERELKAINAEREQIARETEAERQRADTEKQLKEAERQRADTERQRADTERQRADTEKQLRLQAEQENVHLRQLLEQAQSTTIPFTTATAQTTSSTPTSGPAFWQSASTADTSTKKREFDATTDTQLLDPEAKSIEQPTKRVITNLLQDSNDDDDEAKPSEQATKRTATNLSPASDHDDNLNIDIEDQSTHSLR